LPLVCNGLQVEKASRRIHDLEKEIESIGEQAIRDRTQKVEQAVGKIDELNTQIATISDGELVTCRDRLNEINSEIGYRDIL